MADPYASFSRPAEAAADPYAAFSKPAEKPSFLERAGSYAKGALKAAGQGLTFGYADEIGSAIDATIPGREYISRVRPISQAETWQQRYDENLSRERGESKQFREENPATATGANIAGSIAGIVPLMAVAPQSLVAMGPSLGLNVLKTAGTGAVLGGVTGFGEGEGDSRAGNALFGGAIGGVLGGAFPVVGTGVRAAYEGAAPTILRKVADTAEKSVKRTSGGNSLSAAAPDGGPGIPVDSFATRVSDAARNKALSIEDEAAIRRLSIPLSGRNGPEAAQRRLNALGEGAFLGDVNKGTERLAFATQANSDDAAESMLKAYTTRNKATGTRFKEAVPGAPDADSAGKFLAAYTTAEGRQIYDPVLRAGGGKLNVTPELEGLMNRPSIKAAFDTVDEWAAAEGRTLTQAERFHLVKQALNGNAEAKMQTGKAINRKMVSDTADEWEAALWSANPEIKAADQAYAKVASLPEWFERGQNFAAQGRNEVARNASPEALAADLPGATQTQRNVLAAGTASDMRRIASQGPDQTRRMAKQLTEGDDMVARLNEILGPEATERIISRGNAERIFAEKFGNVMRGSQTAERNATLMRDQGISPPATGDIMAVLRWVRDTADKVNTPSETVRRKLGDLLTNPNAAENAETIRLVQEMLARRAPGNALRSAIPGAAGGQFSGP